MTNSSPFFIPAVDQQLFDQTENNLHQAAQIIARFGQTYLPHQDDESHPSMNWDLLQKKLLGRPTEEPYPFRLGVQLPSFELQLLNNQGKVLHSFALAGKTPAEAAEWLRQSWVMTGHEAKNLAEMPYDMPEMKGDHYLENDAQALQAWMAQRSFAHEALEAVRKQFDTTAEINIWPHHFDTGLYLQLKDSDNSQTKALGYGWAIADGMVAENYLYVYAWAPEIDMDYEALSPLNAGHWHIEKDGWKGGILKSSELAAKPTAEEQAEMAAKFLKDSTNGLLKLMNHPKVVR